jgi:rhodanese-related sulfurtransferase
MPDGVGGSTTFKEREILVQHLLVPEDQLQLLLDLQRQVMQDGVDLSDLATEHSICASKSEGGMLGWIALGRTVPEFEEAAFKAPLNKLVRVKTKHGWHLLQVLSEREASFLRDVSVDEFGAKMEDPEFLQEAQLLDVREPDEIATASVEGFKAYPLSQFGQWAPTITEDLDPTKDTYVLCHHGMRSLQAANWLKSQGFTRLYNISGGIHAYSVKVDDSIPKY